MTIESGDIFFSPSTESSQLGLHNYFVCRALWKIIKNLFFVICQLSRSVCCCLLSSVVLVSSSVNLRLMSCLLARRKKFWWSFRVSSQAQLTERQKTLKTVSCLNVGKKLVRLMPAWGRRPNKCFIFFFFGSPSIRTTVKKFHTIYEFLLLLFSVERLRLYWYFKHWVM